VAEVAVPLRRFLHLEVTTLMLLDSECYVIEHWYSVAGVLSGDPLLDPATAYIFHCQDRYMISQLPTLLESAHLA
jgi:hypothetical protein